MIETINLESIFPPFILAVYSLLEPNAVDGLCVTVILAPIPFDLLSSKNSTAEPSFVVKKIFKGLCSNGGTYGMIGITGFGVAEIGFPPPPPLPSNDAWNAAESFIGELPLSLYPISLGADINYYVVLI